MKWKIFYVDGSTFSNKDGNPEDAPGWGVAAVVQEDDVVGVEVSHLNDFYCFSEKLGGWRGMDYFGLAQYIGLPGKKIIKLGDNMSTEEYKKLINRIRKDPEIPSKSARYAWERKL